MSRLYSLIFLIIAGIGFYAGYTVGFKKGQIALILENKLERDASADQAAVAPATETSSEPAVEEEPMDEQTEAMLAEHEFSLRAAQKEITFTDNQGRELIAEVIEANSQTLKVRRISDNLVVDLPIIMLVEADREFAAYLAKQSAQSSTSLTAEDKIWDELFK